MSENRLPTLEEAYESLCLQGDQFAAPHSVTTLDVRFNHPTEGRIPIAIDEHAMATQGEIYSGDLELRDALQDRGIHTRNLIAAGSIIRRYLRSDGLIWGFSGYATEGYDYTTEAQGLTRLHDHLVDIGKKPKLAIDGGVSAGNLGLSGVVAAMHGVETMGIIPREGLASIGTRDHLVIWGDTYRDREVAIGTASDVLVCIGGGEGTQRECQAALRCGGTVLLLALKDYGPHSLPQTYEEFEEMNAAVDAGTMIICESIEDIPEGVDSALATDIRSVRAARSKAMDQLWTQWSR